MIDPELLPQVGLVGFIAYTSGLAWIYYMGIKVIRSDSHLKMFMFPLLIGMTCFLIANATNPYLQKFDYMWTIFLPIVVINRWLMEKKVEQ